MGREPGPPCPADTTRLRAATDGLAERWPQASARDGIHGWQAASLAVAVGLVVGGFLVVPDATVVAAAVAMTLPFLIIVILRLAALIRLSTRWRTRATRLKLGDDDLPVYTLLCPLYREAGVAPQLVEALSRLDYPRSRLDIKLIIEASDTATREALERLRPGEPFEIVVVPDAAPRTKPKALNFALAGARGSLVAIFDAEDHPEPLQLRRAAQVFAESPERVACLQARLAIHNGHEGWLPRLFDVEYTSLFDALLPTYEDLGLILPLGGTSNHFRRAALEEVGAWDAYNVTEDADLGVRLRRAGYRVSMLESETVEEAPASSGDWLRQRTRWMKGWMQTLLVHHREPGRLVRELGLGGTLGFQVVIGGVLLSALVHPFFYLWAGLALAQGQFLVPGEHPLSKPIVIVAASNILLGYGCAILLGMVASMRRGKMLNALAALTLPFYWLLVSAACYRAVWQLWRDPFRWEKTTHRPYGAIQPGRHTRRLA